MNLRYSASEISLGRSPCQRASGHRGAHQLWPPQTLAMFRFPAIARIKRTAVNLTRCLQDKTDIELDQAVTTTGRCVEMTSFQSKWQLGKEIDKLKKAKKKKVNFSSRTTTGENLRRRLRRRQTCPEIARLQRAPDHLTWCAPSFYQMETIQKECSALNETQISRWRWVPLVHICACRVYESTCIKKPRVHFRNLSSRHSRVILKCAIQSTLYTRGLSIDNFYRLLFESTTSTV